ncbi:MAG: SDR family NAD(P)-dependent oxidoreductase [bacterium]|nr:SDR family NAD(P)-dependent oxidoreductase [bacterium]
MKPHVCITGGTGFLGRYLVRDFLAAGYAVHVVCRASSDRSVLQELDVQWHTADLMDINALKEALTRARDMAGQAPLWLVHNAALISYASRDTRALHDVNVTGVANVLQESERAGVTKFVHVSSIVTVGFSADGMPRNEDSAFNGAGLHVPYVDTKQLGEELAMQAGSNLQVRTVNPGAIFGPVQENSNSARFLQGMAQGRIGSLAPPGGMAVVGVWDCARGVRLALEKGQAGRRYLLAESYVSSCQLFAEVGQRLVGRDPVKATLPTWIWNGLGLGLSLVSVLKEPKLTSPAAMRMLGVAFDASGKRAREELDWSPEPFAEVLDRTIAEMRRLGILHGP